MGYGYGAWVTVHDGKTGTEIARCAKEGVDGIAWSPDGKQFAAGAGHVAAIFDLAEKRVVRELNSETLLGQGCSTHVMSWSPDGKFLATGGIHGHVAVWNLTDIAERFHLKVAGYTNMHAFQWSADNSQLMVLCGADWRFINIVEKRLLEGWQGRAELLPPSVRLGKDRDLLASVAGDPEMRDCIALQLRDADRGNVFSKFLFPHFTYIYDCRETGAFSPDRKICALVSINTLLLVETETGERLARIVYLPNNGWLSISPEGHYRGSPKVESELRYVVETDAGQDIYTPAEFAAKFGWKNDPEKVGISAPEK
jgi:WD40 repeat protein